MDARTGHEVERLRRQVEVMLGYALDRGLTPAPQAWMFDAVRAPVGVVDLAAEGWNPTATDVDRRAGVEALVRAHRDLSRMVAPARPATLELLQQYRLQQKPSRRGPRIGRLPRIAGIPLQNRARPAGQPPVPAQAQPGGSPGVTLPGTTAAGSPLTGAAGAGPGGRRPGGLRSATVPLLRRLTAATWISLLLFVGFAALPQARAAVAGLDVDGLTGTGVSQLGFGTLLLRELFLLAGAALGSCLTALFRAGKEVLRGSYDPEFDHVYAQRILLGMATGLILAEVLPLGTGPDTAAATLARPAIGLLGGFAAGLVHGVLNRVIGALEALFNGDAEEQEEARRELAAKRVEEMLAQSDRATLAKLLEIRRIASSGSPARAVIDEIDRVISVVAHS